MRPPVYSSAMLDLSKASVDSIQESIARNRKHVHSISFSGNSDMVSDVEKCKAVLTNLKEHLRFAPDLRMIDLSKINFSGAIVMLLKEMIEAGQNLAYVKLHNTSISPETQVWLTSNLQHKGVCVEFSPAPPEVHILSMDRAGLFGVPLRDWSKAVSGKIYREPLNKEEISQRLSQNPAATHIDLSFNFPLRGRDKLTVATILQALVAYIATSTKLIFLDLSCNNLDDSEIIALAKAIKLSHSLAYLSLRANNFSEVGAQALAEAIAGKRAFHLDIYSVQSASGPSKQIESIFQRVISTNSEVHCISGGAGHVYELKT